MCRNFEVKKTDIIISIGNKSSLVVVKRKTAWYNHPAVKMWKTCELWLILYGLVICAEWKKRGYKDTMFERFKKEMIELQKKKMVPFKPSWLGNKKFHKAMKSNLLRKDKKYYSKYFKNVPDNLPYIWGNKNV